MQVIMLCNLDKNVWFCCWDNYEKIITYAATGCQGEHLDGALLIFITIMRIEITCKIRIIVLLLHGIVNK